MAAQRFERDLPVPREQRQGKRRGGRSRLCRRRGAQQRRPEQDHRQCPGQTGHRPPPASPPYDESWCHARPSSGHDAVTCHMAPRRDAVSLVPAPLSFYVPAGHEKRVVGGAHGGPTSSVIRACAVSGIARGLPVYRRPLM